MAQRHNGTTAQRHNGTTAQRHKKTINSKMAIHTDHRPCAFTPLKFE
jgi:hypothetical protein